jgi:hypothetical protein
MDAKDSPFQQTVTTINLSRGGARIEGLFCLKAPGEVIGIQFGKEKARFKVIWIGPAGSPAHGHVGVQSLEPDKHIWGADLPLPRPDHYQPPQISPAEDPFAATLQTYGVQTDERRKGDRHPCVGQAEIWRVGEKSSYVGLLADISPGGCYVQAMSPLENGARVEMVVTVEGTTFRTQGVVCTSHSGMGMGISFVGMANSDRRTLDNIVRRLTGLPPLPELPPEIAAPLHAPEPAPATEAAALHLEASETLAAFETLLDLLARKGVISREEFWAALQKARQNPQR